MLARARLTRQVLLAFLVLFPATAGLAQSDGVVAWWKFDEGAGNIATESVNGSHDTILNHHQWVTGVHGSALKFGGLATLIDHPADAIPHLDRHFSIEAWVAIQAYPWNWVALVDQENDHQSGYYFGIDSRGRLSLQLSVWGDWQTCESQIRVPLNKWSHVVGTYDSNDGIRLYVDGQLQGALPLTGQMTPTTGTGLRIGRNFKDLPADAEVRHKADLPAFYSFDGIIDELKIYDRTLSPDDIGHAYAASKPSAAPELTPRTWPFFSQDSKHFGAAYTSLKLYPEWDELWRTGPDADVVVSFADLPFHYVFWRGNNYGEALVTENGIWTGDQSFESHTHRGTAEHMNDKHNAYSHISIVESNEARVVLHWRYALADIAGEISNPDPVTGWGDRADEYFYIYPDGGAVRYGTIRGTASHYSFSEPTILVAPGKKAEDYISLDAATIANSNGESKTYSWDPASPPFPFPGQPADANIAELNVKSPHKPYFIYQPGTELGPYGWPPELRSEYSHFPTWDHWPVNQIPSDGRFAIFPDHYGSAAIMSPNPKNAWIVAPGQRSTYFLFGLTDQNAPELAALDRSWLQPPNLSVKGGGFTAAYDRSQRAYVLTPATKDVRTNSKDRNKLELTFEASPKSPVVNPALVIKNWGNATVRLKVDGVELPKSKARVALVQRIDGTDLVAWIEYKSERPCHLSLVTTGKASEFVTQ